MIQPLTPWSQPPSREERLALSLAPPVARVKRRATLLQRLADGVVLCLAVLALVAVVLCEVTIEAVDRFDFRTFDLRATAICKWVVICVAVYLAFMIYAAWCNGSFDRLVR